MQRFTGSWSNRLSLLLMLAMSAGVIYFGLFPTNHRLDTSLLVGRGLFLLMGGGMGLFMGYGLLESFAVYQADETSVARRAWNGTREMRWSQVDRYDMSGQKDSTCVLFDESGGKLPIHLTLLDKKSQTELRALLQKQLSPLRERQLRNIGSTQKTYYPSRTAAGAGLFLVVLFGVMLLFFGFMPVPPEQRTFQASVLFMMAAAELYFVYLTMQSYTRVLSVTAHELNDKDLFRTKRIPFHHVTAIWSREVRGKNSTWEVTVLEGDGQKISFTSRTKDYDLLVQYLRTHTGQQAVQEGQVKAEEVKQKTAKQAKVLLPVIGLIYFLLLGGMGLWMLRQGNARMMDYRLMDTQGRTVTGQILGAQDTHKKSARYLIQFAFEVDGQRIQSASPVSQNDYQQAQVGAPVTVTYVPGQPHICRIPQSIGKRQAEGNIRVGYMNLVLGAVTLAAIVLLPRFKRKTPASA